MAAPSATPSPVALARVHASPNPTRGATTLSIDLPAGARGSLGIYDLSGRLVRDLVAGSLTGGHHQVKWDGRNTAGDRVAAGVYFSRLEAAGIHANQRIIVVR